MGGPQPQLGDAANKANKASKAYLKTQGTPAQQHADSALTASLTVSMSPAKAGK